MFTVHTQGFLSSRRAHDSTHENLVPAAMPRPTPKLPSSRKSYFKPAPIATLEGTEPDPAATHVELDTLVVDSVRAATATAEDGGVHDEQAGLMTPELQSQRGLQQQLGILRKLVRWASCCMALLTCTLVVGVVTYLSVASTAPDELAKAGAQWSVEGSITLVPPSPSFALPAAAAPSTVPAAAPSFTPAPAATPAAAILAPPPPAPAAATGGAAAAFTPPTDPLGAEDADTGYVWTLPGVTTVTSAGYAPFFDGIGAGKPFKAAHLERWRNGQPDASFESLVALGYAAPADVAAATGSVSQAPAPVTPRPLGPAAPFGAPAMPTPAFQAEVAPGPTPPPAWPAELAGTPIYHDGDPPCRSYCSGECCGFSDPSKECGGCDLRASCNPARFDSGDCDP